MQISLIQTFFEKISNRFFFLLVVAYQVIFLFQGFDFADTGFDAIFYKRFFDAPQTVQYNFLYWLTGAIGGSILRLFPHFGLLGLRIAGVIVTTSTLLIAFNLLKKYLQPYCLKLGLFIIILLINSDTKELYYNDLTAFFFVTSAWFLFYGLIKDQPLKIFCSGLFISMNMFARLPNVLDLTLIISIIYFGISKQAGFKKIARQISWLVFGFVVMSVLLFALMIKMNHLSVFLGSIHLAKEMGKSHETTHGIFAMSKVYITQYALALFIGISALISLAAITAVVEFVKRKFHPNQKILSAAHYLILCIIVVVCVYVSSKNPDFWLYLCFFFSGIILITSLLILIGKEGREIKLLTLIGCTMLIVIPFGSDFALLNLVSYCLWISLPITVNYLLGIKQLSTQIKLTENKQYEYEQIIGPGQLNAIKKYSLFICLVIGLCNAYFYPHFDRSPRTKMFSRIENPNARGILTTKERAGTVNELLNAGNQYIKPGDYVLGYDCMPLFYYLTDTKPYMYNSWPGLYDETMFRKQLYKSLDETKKLPIIIMQKRSTIANNWPDNYDENYQFRKGSVACLQEFMGRYDYKQVWENDFFRLFIPPSQSPSAN